MPRTPSTHSSANAAPVRTAQRVRPPRSGGAGGCDADRRDDGWGPYGTPPDHAAAMRLAALFDDAEQQEQQEQEEQQEQHEQQEQQEQQEEREEQEEEQEEQHEQQ